ncbi:DUF4153 domain-containing protein [Streptomyces sp. NPDC008121]|uniref:DUF4153 domain-containing protein n=1 Tax=Streptomyces sp. NPDC008121 TaxID=3364809 RepID=UPI0036F131AE
MSDTPEQAPQSGTPAEPEPPRGTEAGPGVSPPHRAEPEPPRTSEAAAPAASAQRRPQPPADAGPAVPRPAQPSSGTDPAVPQPQQPPAGGGTAVPPPAQRSSGGGAPVGAAQPRATGRAGARPPHPDWRVPVPVRESRLDRLRPDPPAGVTLPTLGAIAVTALLSALLLGDGIGLNLLIVAVPAVLAASFAARAAGRRPRPWTLAWAVGGLALLVVPALLDAGWPTFLAIVSALVLTALALHGGRGWPSVLFGPVGLLDSLGPGVLWVWRGLRERADGTRGRAGPVLRTVGVAVLLLVVFGALFAGADAAFADLLGSLIPDISVSQAPWRFSFLLLGLFGAISLARTAAAPLRWDRVVFAPGRARGRLEWALPLIVLNLLFAAFNAVQLTVLLGGYGQFLSEPDPDYSQYARQGFWQLLTATLLTLAVIGLALRWAPRSNARDRTLVRAVLGTLCALTLVVVASALRRMDLYVDAYGLTRLRISVAAMEIWLGVVILLIMAAGIFGARLLPRALAASAATAVLVFGLASPDALVAERNVERYAELGDIDLNYLQGLSADAVPALDRLPEPQRSCALHAIDARLRLADGGWYATSWSQTRARDILAERGVTRPAEACRMPSREGEYDPYADDDPYSAP